jgi:hypothetical protein
MQWCNGEGVASDFLGILPWDRSCRTRPEPTPATDGSPKADYKAVSLAQAIYPGRRLNQFNELGRHQSCVHGHAHSRPPSISATQYLDLGHPVRRLGRNEGGRAPVRT